MDNNAGGNRSSLAIRLISHSQHVSLGRDSLCKIHLVSVGWVLLIPSSLQPSSSPLLLFNRFLHIKHFALCVFKLTTGARQYNTCKYGRPQTNLSDRDARVCNWNASHIVHVCVCVVNISLAQLHWAPVKSTSYGFLGGCLFSLNCYVMTNTPARVRLSDAVCKHTGSESALRHQSRRIKADGPLVPQ